MQYPTVLSTTSVVLPIDTYFFDERVEMDRYNNTL